MPILTPHAVGTGRSALLVRHSRGEEEEKHFTFTDLQNVTVISLVLNLNIRLF